MPYDDAITKAKQHSRNYAKRQMTWIRNQMPEAAVVEGAESVINKLS
jgi:tRNA A37 N6-isopentenylltransferase MiaA